jgi:phosphohistidine phosphatase
MAEERGDAWPDDSKRPLTDEGVSRMRKSARGLARIGVAIDIILTSPLVRARQTAELVAGGLDPRPALVNVDSLAPDGGYAAVLADLQKHARRPRVALVGHEPMLGELAARLIGSRHAIEFKKGAVCRIDIDDLPPAGPGELRWMLTPKIMRALKK